MRDFAQYLRDYFRVLPKIRFLILTLFTAVLIWLNYTVGIEWRIKQLDSWPLRLLAFYSFYAFVFLSAYRIIGVQHGAIRSPPDRRFFLLLLLAPLLFSMKAVPWNLEWVVHSYGYPWNRYLSILLQLPAKAVCLSLVLLFIWKAWIQEEPVLGLQVRKLRIYPYLILLLLILPAIALAATRPDFLRSYPKFHSVSFLSTYVRSDWLWNLLYEISYGIDFYSIELFFRGYLVLGFLRFAGPGAIMPMIAFYCCIHFGKPLGECISSYFGGLLLGIVAYRTRSIVGGLCVHLGIAWSMEWFGWAGHIYFNSR
jgi:hypothetical protein